MHLATINSNIKQKSWKYVVKQLEKMLYEYTLFQTSLDNEAELEKAGLSNHYPSMTASYEEKVSRSYSEYQSSTEKYGIKNASKKLRVHQMERALAVLVEDEKMIIHHKYLQPERISDSLVYDQLGISRSTFYRHKKTAFEKLAVALNLLPSRNELD
ncbi:hypothetical protein IC619_012425 [Hazenella sp. IB182353]|uniref:ArpU family phage packaging/lysis transcriptional regulator n=1 Tax=Polycladospora coralii TaxID=2771432 RepID=UPI001746DB00|nr:ArpU family phage packaging/lysis transcriptional regulator [Polycladospora coralii]MBS7531298.1 hypothetical protein [Polycladospora coralii]